MCVCGCVCGWVGGWVGGYVFVVCICVCVCGVCVLCVCAHTEDETQRVFTHMHTCNVQMKPLTTYSSGKNSGMCVIICKCVMNCSYVFGFGCV